MTPNTVDEETLNVEIRKFLKRVGITSQREIELAVRTALQTGRIKGDELLRAEMVLTIPALDLLHRIDGEIALKE
jgi:hypothetical protein